MSTPKSGAVDLRWKFATRPWNIFPASWRRPFSSASSSNSWRRSSRQQARERTVPRFVEREFGDYLTCGVAEHGFLRLRCDDCSHDRVLAFSCKKQDCVQAVQDAECRITRHT